MTTVWEPSDAGSVPVNSLYEMLSVLCATSNQSIRVESCKATMGAVLSSTHSRAVMAVKDGTAPVNWFPPSWSILSSNAHMPQATVKDGSASMHVILT